VEEKTLVLHIYEPGNMEWGVIYLGRGLTETGLLRGPPQKMTSIFGGRPVKTPISVNEF
jgi:hypothetical protein